VDFGLRVMINVVHVFGNIYLHTQKFKNMIFYLKKCLAMLGGGGLKKPVVCHINTFTTTYYVHVIIKLKLKF
jgi:hypothetical protein